MSLAPGSTRVPVTPTRATGTETILLVEDELAVRNIAERILRSAGYSVLVASNGEDAIRVSDEHDDEIELVLTDVVMPQMSGRACAEQIVKNHPRVRVMYMSGYTDNAIVHHGRLDARTHFIAKPFNAADLTRKVREALDDASMDDERVSD